VKAAVTDGKGRVWLADVPVPEPTGYECLCQTLACATCTGTDRKHMHNKLPWKQDYPGLLGHESIGRVIQVGPKVRNLKNGDIVLRPAAAYPDTQLAGYSSMWGGFAEYGLVTDRRAALEDDPGAEPPAYSRFQLPIPSAAGISPVDATMLITLKETASYVASLGVTLNTSVAVLGSGSVGISMMRFAKIFGAVPVIAVGRRDEPLAYATERIGADAAVNAQKENPVKAVRRLTGGAGVERIIDTTGNADFLNTCLPMLTDTGKAAPYATYEADDTIRKTVDPDRILRGKTGEDAAHQYLLDAVRLGLVDLADYYSHRLPFARIAEGFEMLERKTAFKIVFEMED